MFCRKCGTELSPGDRFCPNCGAEQMRDYAADVNNARAGRPDNYIWFAVLVTVLCCMPLGIVSIINSAKVDSTWAAGDYDEAWKYSRRARNWAWWAVASSVIFVILYLIFCIALGVGFGVLADAFSSESFI